MLTRKKHMSSYIWASYTDTFDNAYTSNAHGTLYRQYNTFRLWVGLGLW